MGLDRKRKRTSVVEVHQKKPHVVSEVQDQVPEEGSGDEYEEGLSGDEEMDGESDEAEEDTWGGIGGNVENAQAQKSREDGAHSKTKVPPTAQELRSIRDATDLYRSSSFKLQIDALLPNVRPKQSRSTQLVHFLHSLHTFILSLNPIPAKHPLEASRELKKKGICVPYPLPTPSEDTNWKVTFEPPTDIILAGSWANEMSVKSKDNEPFRVDLALIMPASLFQEKDYLNARFLHKRAYYLAVINSALSAKDSGYNVECLYGTIRGDPRLTSLVVRPKPDGSQNDFTKLNAEVRIIPTLPSDSPIPINRLSPSRANIRTSSSSEDSSADLATPLYNTTILTATTPKSHLLRMNALKKLVPAFSDALALLRVWANQRGYGQGTRLCVRGFDGTGMMWGVLLDLLISGEEPVNTAVSRTANARKPLGKGLSSYQLFRAALDFLARHDFSRPTFVKSENGHRFPPEEYGVHDAVLVDATSTVNVFAGIPLGSLELLKYDATLTLEALNDAALSVDPFDEVFMRDHRDLQTRFDIVLRVDLTSAKLRNPSIRDTLEHGSQYNALLASMSSNLRKALGNRARAVVMLHPTGQSWPVSQMHPPNHPVVYVGLILDTEHAFRLVDHGPSAEEAETAVAKNFREFWGDKAELRRFKDGSISESVVWEVKTADERAHIPFFICRHILQLHHGIPAAELQHWQAPFDAVVRLPESITSLYRSAKLDLGFKAALGAFDQLVKSIKALDEEIPLAVLNVSPVSEHLRYTNVFAPTPLPTSLATALPRCAQYMPVMDIIIEFEKSGRWPDDLRAIQKIKLAFFERLATALMHQTPGLKANVVVGETKPVSEIQDAAQLEIVTPQGWAFSARIWHEREATLLDNTIDDKPHIPKHVKKNLPSSVDPKERHDAIVAKEIYTRRFIHAPRHHRAIAALCHRYTAYAGTVRLVKRWFASHWLLGSHVTPEVVELLCARAFLGGGMISGSKSPAHVPGTKERGFARVIELLKDWEWENGLFVPLYGDEETAAENKETAVVEIVSAGPKTGVWKVSTEFDRDGHMWTKDGPDAVVARRIRALAKATWGMAQKIEHDGYDVLTLFSHPTEHYDFIVHLDPSILPRYCQNVKADPSVWLHKGKYANLQQADVTSGKDIRAGFDPALLLFKDLSSIYRDTFKIFYDPLGGDRFGAVWDPSLKQPRPFRVLGGFSSIPQRKEEASKEKDKGLVTLNVDAVLLDTGYACSLVELSILLSH